MTLDQLIAVWSAVGQVAAALLGLVALIVSVRTAKKQALMSESLAHEQSALLFEQVRMQRDSDVLRWTEAVIDVLADADTFLNAQVGQAFDELAQARLRNLLGRLSSLIDHGRMYFPNETPEKKGAEKPVAYQGFRQRILDVLVFAYDVLAGADKAVDSDGMKKVCVDLFDLRRQFVSEAQMAIDPRRFIALKEMNSIRATRGVAAQTSNEQDRPRVLGKSAANGNQRV